MSIHSKGPTLERLASVWERRNKRLHWPATFQEAMESPIYSRLLQIEATRADLRREVARVPALQSRVSSPVTVDRIGERRAAERRARWMDTDERESDSGTLDAG